MGQYHRNASNRRAVIDIVVPIVAVITSSQSTALTWRVLIVQEHCHSSQAIHCSCDGGSFAAPAIDPCCQGRAATSKRAVYTQAMIHNPQSLNVCVNGRTAVVSSFVCGFGILTCEPEQESDPRTRSASFRPRPRLTSASGSYLVLLLLPPPTLKNPLIASFTREKKFRAKIKELENHRCA